MNTQDQYQTQIARCRDLFLKKTTDYGTSWRILRLPSLTDQIFIKAMRLRSIQEKLVQKVADAPADEYIGMVNYCLIALIQTNLPANTPLELPVEQVKALYDAQSDAVFKLMLDKNHDYGEAWRDMRLSSLTDLILMKLLRIKQIEDNQGQTLVSEGIDANYFDIINYSIFSLIKLSETAE